MHDLRYYAPKYNESLRLTSSRMRAVTPIAVAILSLGFLLGTIVLAAYGHDPHATSAPGPFPTKTYQCLATGVVYPTTDVSCSEFLVIEPGARAFGGQATDFRTLFENNLSAISPWYFWMFGLAVITLLLGWLLKLTVHIRVALAGKRYAAMKSRAEQAARRRLYAVIKITSNTRSIYVDLCSVDGITQLERTRFLRSEVRWAPGTSDQSVAWMTGASYRSDGTFNHGEQLLIMSPCNDHRLVEAKEKILLATTLDHLELLKKL